MLHSNPVTLKVSEIQEEPGVHAVIKTPLDCMDGGEGLDSPVVYVRCDRSLREFCKLHLLPEGVRGPETWGRPLPWSKKDPASFCSKVAELKYRWESGRRDFTEAPARDSGKWSWNNSVQLQDWKRSSDGKLIPKRERFWHLIDLKESLTRQTRAEGIS